jgi:hypothetical protein
MEQFFENAIDCLSLPGQIDNGCFEFLSLKSQVRRKPKLLIYKISRASLPKGGCG